MGRGKLAPAVLFLAACVLAQDGAALKNSADRRLEAGDSDGAFSLYQQAVASDSVEAGGLSLEIARQYYAKADFPHSRVFAERALAIHQKVSGPRSPATARALVAMGMAQYGSGDYAGATPRFELGWQILQENLGAENQETVAAQNRLALNLLRAGDSARARILEEQALAICQERFGPEHPLTLEAHRYLGQILNEMGDYPAAQQHQIVALAALERKAGSDAIEVADTLVTMSNSARDAGYYADAKAYSERAAVIYEARLGPHNTRLGGTLDNLGQVLGLMKRFAEARQVFERALAIQTQELGPRHPWTGNVLQGMAKIEAAQGNYQKARELYEQNLSIWREKLGPQHPFTVVSITLLSDVLAHLGRYPEALDTALEAADIRRENILLTVRTVDERQALKYADLHTASMDTALSIAARPDASAADQAKAWDALIRSRALVLDEMSARYKSIHGAVDPQVAALAQTVAAARGQITKLVLQGPGKSSPVEYRQVLERSRAELERDEDRLAVASAGFRRERDQHRIGYSAVRAALPPGSGLVAFRRYRRKDYQAAGDSSTESYVAFVLAGPQGLPVAIPLGGAARIESLVAKWRGEIDRERTSLGRAARNNEASYRLAAAALRQAVWDPLQRRLGAVKRLYIVPDGALQLVNFAALPSTEGHYLVETGPLLHVLTAERDLTDPAAAPAGTRLLAVANPAFQDGAAPPPAAHRGANPSCADFASVQFGSLPGSLEEVRAILQIWNSRGWQGQELSGKDATESAVKQNVAGKRVVHLATHGFFLNGECPQTAGAARENPLLRSGLALAGANRRQAAANGQEDGILTAEEVASLDLGGAEWVVLSGCDTGVGDPKTGEGVLGLLRSFQEAGARTLIASLWPVDDQEARQWMVALYRARFVEGRETAESIREADLEQLRSRRAAGKSQHPFYWAGFLAVGDWR
jgi:CHAT domain-containing protein/Tfp pilus assembly protein PilF